VASRAALRWRCDRELHGTPLVPLLLLQVGRVIGTEARASGITQCWSPVCGLARETRWGRAEEEFGEDTFLAGELAGAMASGMVGAAPGVANLSAPDTVAPLLKHFAGYSVPEGGHNAAPSQFGGVRELLSEYLPVFHKAVLAGAQGVSEWSCC
jgi:beta-glucosidase